MWVAEVDLAFEFRTQTLLMFEDNPSGIGNAVADCVYERRIDMSSRQRIRPVCQGTLLGSEQVHQKRNMTRRTRTVDVHEPAGVAIRAVSEDKFPHVLSESQLLTNVDQGSR